MSAQVAQTDADEPIAEFSTGAERWELYNVGRESEVEIVHYVDDGRGEEETQRWRMNIASIHQCIYKDRFPSAREQEF